MTLSRVMNTIVISPAERRTQRDRIQYLSHLTSVVIHQQQSSVIEM